MLFLRNGLCEYIVCLLISYIDLDQREICVQICLHRQSWQSLKHRLFSSHRLLYALQNHTTLAACTSLQP